MSDSSRSVICSLSATSCTSIVGSLLINSNLIFRSLLSYISLGEVALDASIHAFAIAASSIKEVLLRPTDDEGARCLLLMIGLQIETWLTRPRLSDTKVLQEPGLKDLAIFDVGAETVIIFVNFDADMLNDGVERDILCFEIVFHV